MQQQHWTLPAGGEAVEAFSRAQRLGVRQRVELSEAFFGIERRNLYWIQDAQNGLSFYSHEQGGGLFGVILRQILKGMRPFRMEVRDKDQKPLLGFHRPFRLFFYRLDVYDANSRLLGSVRRRFSVLRRRYVIESPGGRELAELFGPLLKPWTFEIQVRGQRRGLIRKQWSGLAKEFFTEADNFQVIFEESLEQRLRPLCLGATFLIDYAHFEK